MNFESFLDLVSLLDAIGFESFLDVIFEQLVFDFVAAIFLSLNDH